MKTKWIRIIALFLVMSLFISNFCGVEMVQAGESGQMDSIVISGDGYCVNVREQNSWTDGFIAEVEVTNTGSSVLKNWSVLLELSNGTVINSWNAACRQDGKQCVFECKEYNRSVNPGESVSFGCQIEGASFEDLGKAGFRQKTRRVNAKEEYETEYRIVDQWENYANIEVELYNHTSEDIEDWNVSFDFSGSIETIWNADMISNTNGCYRIGNKTYNATIHPGQSTKFGFQARFADGKVTCPGEGVLDCVTASQVSEEQEDEEFDPETDAYVYHDIENQDWNMEMIHADSDVVKEALDHPNGAIRVALLDSGVNYSDEVYVSERKNFVPGEDDYSELYEDVSGHGTAIAEVLASNPNGKQVEIGSDSAEDKNVYQYYDESGNVQKPDADDAEGEKPQVEGSLLEVLESGYEWNQGVNPTVDLISAKVLDKDNVTTVDRVVQAIDWAIEQDSDIISMSFGMDGDSARLHQAVKKAKDAGILIIAAAGNGQHVEYPAAYPEVMAVGSVDSLAERSVKSASGKEIEVVAPGEFVLSRGAFDSMQIFSGTSMAVPHVVGLASILWQKDTSKSAGFIRKLLQATARECGTSSDCGYGLIDCEYALKNYDEFERQYEEDPKEVLLENTEEIDVDEEVRNLYGNWRGEEHEAFVSSYVDEEKETWNELEKYVKILKRGATFVDNEKSGCRGMHVAPWFHGYYGKDEIYKGEKTVVSNYLASFYYLYTLAKDMYDDGELDLTDTDSSVFQKKDNTELKNSYQGINAAFKDTERIGKWKWEKIHEYCKQKADGTIPKKERSLVLLGMALHTATDTYAHSSFCWSGTKKKKIIWKAITHSDVYKGAKKADSTKYVERRYQDAKRVAKALLGKVKVRKGEFTGFESDKSAISIYSAQKDYNGILNSGKYIQLKHLKSAYALKKSYDYAHQLKELCDNNTEAVKRITNKLKKIDLNNLREKTEAYKYYRGKKKAVKEKGEEKEEDLIAEIYELRDEQSGEMLMDIKSDTNSFDVIVANDSTLKMVEKQEKKQKLCCRFSGGQVLGADENEIPELEEEGNQDEGQIQETEDDSEEMCTFYCFEFDAASDDHDDNSNKNSAYRVEMTWEDSSLDLDLLMMAMFPYAEQFYLTCRVEKTTYPELGDVFQSDRNRASLDRDVKDASGAETIKIHKFEKDAVYLFFVRNYTEDYPVGSEKEIARSGAMIKVYRGQEKKPIYTARVPVGEGYYWNAICLWGDTGELQPIDTITEEAMG